MHTGRKTWLRKSFLAFVSSVGCVPSYPRRREMEEGKGWRSRNAGVRRKEKGLSREYVVIGVLKGSPEVYV